MAQNLSKYGLGSKPPTKSGGGRAPKKGRTTPLETYGLTKAAPTKKRLTQKDISYSMLRNLVNNPFVASPMVMRDANIPEDFPLTYAEQAKLLSLGANIPSGARAYDKDADKTISNRRGATSAIGRVATTDALRSGNEAVANPLRDIEQTRKQVKSRMGMGDSFGEKATTGEIVDIGRGYLDAQKAVRDVASDTIEWLKNPAYNSLKTAIGALEEGRSWGAASIDTHGAGSGAEDNLQAITANRLSKWDTRRADESNRLKRAEEARNAAAGLPVNMDPVARRKAVTDSQEEYDKARYALYRTNAANRLKHAALIGAQLGDTGVAVAHQFVDPLGIPGVSRSQEELDRRDKARRALQQSNREKAYNLERMGYDELAQRAGAEDSFVGSVVGSMLEDPTSVLAVGKKLAAKAATRAVASEIATGKGAAKVATDIMADTARVAGRAAQAGGDDAVAAEVAKRTQRDIAESIAKQETRGTIKAQLADITAARGKAKAALKNAVTAEDATKAQKAIKKADKAERAILDRLFPEQRAAELQAAVDDAEEVLANTPRVNMSDYEKAAKRARAANRKLANFDPRQTGDDAIQSTIDRLNVLYKNAQLSGDIGTMRKLADDITRMEAQKAQFISAVDKMAKGQSKTLGDVLKGAATDIDSVTLADEIVRGSDGKYTADLLRKNVNELTKEEQIVVRRALYNASGGMTAGYLEVPFTQITADIPGADKLGRFINKNITERQLPLIGNSPKGILEDVVAAPFIKNSDRGTGPLLTMANRMARQTRSAGIRAANEAAGQFAHDLDTHAASRAAEDSGVDITGMEQERARGAVMAGQGVPLREVKQTPQVEQLYDGDVWYRRGAGNEYSEFTSTGQMNSNRGTGIASGQYSFGSEAAANNGQETVTAVRKPSNPLVLTSEDNAINQGYNGGYLVHRASKKLLEAAELNSAAPRFTEVADLLEDALGLRVSIREVADAVRIWNNGADVHPLNILLGKKGYDGIEWAGDLARFADDGTYGNITFPRVDSDFRAIGRFGADGDNAQRPKYVYGEDRTAEPSADVFTKPDQSRQAIVSRGGLVDDVDATNIETRPFNVDEQVLVELYTGQAPIIPNESGTKYTLYGLDGSKRTFKTEADAIEARNQHVVKRMFGDPGKKTTRDWDAVDKRIDAALQDQSEEARAYAKSYARTILPHMEAELNSVLIDDIAEGLDVSFKQNYAPGAPAKTKVLSQLVNTKNAQNVLDAEGVNKTIEGVSSKEWFANLAEKNPKFAEFLDMMSGGNLLNTASARKPGQSGGATMEFAEDMFPTGGRISVGDSDPGFTKAKPYETPFDRVITGSAALDTEHSLATAAGSRVGASKVAKVDNEWLKTQAELFGTPLKKKGNSWVDRAGNSVPRDQTIETADGMRYHVKDSKRLQNIKTELETRGVAASSHQSRIGAFMNGLYFPLMMGLRPAFIAINTLGNVAQMVERGHFNPTDFQDAFDTNVAMLKATKGIGDSDKAIRSLASKTRIVNGRERTMEELAREAELAGVINRFDNPSTEYNLSGAHWMDEVPVIGKFIKTSRDINTTSENTARFAIYLGAIDKGMTPAQARQIVDDVVFDYDIQDLTGVEQHIRSFVAPFYTFQRRNIPNQVEFYGKRPGRMAMAARAQMTADRMTGTDRENMEQNEVNQMGVQIGDTYVPLRTPSADVAKLALDTLASRGKKIAGVTVGNQTADVAGQWALNQVGPQVKVPAAFLGLLSNPSDPQQQKLAASSVPQVGGFMRAAEQEGWIPNPKTGERMTEEEGLSPGAMGRYAANQWLYPTKYVGNERNREFRDAGFEQARARDIISQLEGKGVDVVDADPFKQTAEYEMRANSRIAQDNEVMNKAQNKIVSALRTPEFNDSGVLAFPKKEEVGVTDTNLKLMQERYPELYKLAKGYSDTKDLMAWVDGGQLTDGTFMNQYKKDIEKRYGRRFIQKDGKLNNRRLYKAGIWNSTKSADIKREWIEANYLNR